MKLAFTTAFADAARAWRRDSVVLLPLAGLTMFLPHYAVLLLVPQLALPEGVAGEPAAQAAVAAAMQAWLAEHGGWYVAMSLLGLFGALTVMALYVAAGRPTLGRALGRAAALFLRYLLASLLLGFAAVPVLMVGLASPLLIAAVIPLAFYILGRTMLAGPAIVGEAPLGAVAAITRSWRLTRGNGWLLGATYAAPLFAAQLISGALLTLGEMGGGNPAVSALFDALAALVAMAAMLTLALVEATLYRRLANRGT